MAQPSGPRAGFWRRLAAAFVDGLIISIPVGIIVYLIRGAYDQNASNGLNTLAGLIYYSYFEGLTGRTPGKRLLKIRVVDARTNDGSPIGYARAAIRYLMSIISLIPIGLGYLWMLWDGEKQTWHDKVSGAYVVPQSAFPATVAGSDDALSGTTFDR